MKKIKISKEYIICFLVTLLFFGIFIVTNYTTDTYAIINSPSKEIMSNFLASGRIFTILLYSLYKYVGINFNIVYLISYVIAIFAFSYSIYKVYKLFDDKIKNKTLLFLVSIVTIINPFSIEMLIYFEKGIMSLSILFIVCAVEQFEYFLESSDKKRILKSLLFMLLATFCYQGTLGLFVPLCSIFIFMNSKKFLDFVKNTIISGIIYVIPPLINVLIIKIFSNNQRLSGKGNLLYSINKIFGQSLSMFKSFNIFNHNIFAIMIILLNIITIFFIIYRKKNIIINLIKLIYLEIIIYIFAVAPQIVNSYQNIWLVPRSTYSFAAIIGLILLFLMTEEKVNKKIELILLIILFVFLSYQYYRFIKIEVDNYKVAYNDQINANIIKNEILKYEKDSGKKIKYINFYDDSNKNYTYADIVAVGDVNISGFSPEWSDINIINYYNDSKYKKSKEIDKQYEKKCKEKDWTEIDNRALYFNNETLNVCKF